MSVCLANSILDLVSIYLILGFLKPHPGSVSAPSLPSKEARAFGKRTSSSVNGGGAMIGHRCVDKKSPIEGHSAETCKKDGGVRVLPSKLLAHATLPDGIPVCSVSSHPRECSPIVS